MRPCSYGMSGAVARAARVLFIVAVVSFGVRSAGLLAAAAEQPEQIHFKPGTSSTVLQGTLKGWAMKEYALRANQGQRAQLEVTSKRINWLIVRFYPADESEGDHDLLNSDNTNSFAWEGTLPESGEYVLRLFIRRAEARRGGRVDYRARLTILPRQ